MHKNKQCTFYRPCDDTEVQLSPLMDLMHLTEADTETTVRNCPGRSRGNNKGSSTELPTQVCWKGHLLHHSTQSSQEWVCSMLPGDQYIYINWWILRTSTSFWISYRVPTPPSNSLHHPIHHHPGQGIGLVGKEPQCWLLCWYRAGSVVRGISAHEERAELRKQLQQH